MLTRYTSVFDWKLTGNQRTSDKFFPTAGKSFTTSIPNFSSSSFAPIPERFSICGVLNAPAAMITSLLAETRKRGDDLSFATSIPVARGPESEGENRTRVVYKCKICGQG